MIVQFSVSNYRSIQDKVVLSLLASTDTSHKHCLIPVQRQNILPAAALYGVNASGKSNILMALQLMQSMVAGDHAQPLKEKRLPFSPFAFVESVTPEPTEFEIVYYHKDVKYAYSYSYNESEIVAEHLYHWPNGREALVFSRERGKFKFMENKNEQNTLAGRTPANRLYLVSSNEWNLKQTELAYQWFMEKLTVSSDQDTPGATAMCFRYGSDEDMRQKVLKELLMADLGIADIGVSNIPEDKEEMIISVVHRVNRKQYNLPFQAARSDLVYREGYRVAGYYFVLPLGISGSQEGKCAEGLPAGPVRCDSILRR